MDKPLVVTDGRYLWVHHQGKSALGPLNYNKHPTEEGQIDIEVNNHDPYGCPVNPRACLGGRVHIVKNPMSPPSDLWQS